MSQKCQDEKRSFFRIDDLALLQLREVSSDEVSRLSAEDQLSIDKLTLKARFDSISRELRPLHNIITSKSTHMAEYLAALDNKLNLLSEFIMQVEKSEMDVESQQVNIGAGGVSFIHGSPIMIGAMLELRLVLLPEDAGVFSYARVVSCSRMEECDGYRVALEFIGMDDEVRDLITRHVLLREQEELKKRA